VSYYQSRRRGNFIIDERFVGRSIEVYTIDGDKLMGLVDEVSSYEIGMLVENAATIIPRSSIVYVVTGQSDVHGYGECCEKDFVLDEEFIGSDVEVKLINNYSVSGRLVKAVRNEIAVLHQNRAYVIPRNGVVYIKILKRL
jgi:RNase P/RNase MRP subunit p29